LRHNSFSTNFSFEQSLFGGVEPVLPVPVFVVGGEIGDVFTGEGVVEGGAEGATELTAGCAEGEALPDTGVPDPVALGAEGSGRGALVVVVEGVGVLAGTTLVGAITCGVTGEAVDGSAADPRSTAK